METCQRNHRTLRHLGQVRQEAEVKVKCDEKDKKQKHESKSKRRANAEHILFSMSEHEEHICGTTWCGAHLGMEFGRVPFWLKNAVRIS